MQKYIYLVLSSSNSLPAKIIKFAIKTKLNHSSISLDTSLTKMYSFGRLWMWLPFYAGFVEENKNKGFYKKFTDTYIKLYRFPVPDEIFKKTSGVLTLANKSKSAFRYNFLGAMLVPFNHPIIRDNQFFCSEFVACLFKDCGIREITRDVHTYKPEYFEELPDKELLYEGQLSDYNEDEILKKFY